MRKVGKAIVQTLLILIITMLVGNAWVIFSTRSRVADHLDKLAPSGVALVLGTSKRLQGGQPNLFFRDRITAARDLYLKGKVRHILLSGDNRTRYYNEPGDMKVALVKAGIPEKNITLDYGGLRTLDSVVRAHNIFGQDELIIVTQRFHAYRALFIADYYQLNATVYAADFESQIYGQLAFREVVARLLSILDLYVLDTQPHFDGETQPIIVDEEY